MTPPQPPKVSAPPKAPKPPSASGHSTVKRIYNKKELVLSVVFIVLAFLCVFFVVYLMVTSHRQVTEQYTQLEEVMTALNAESESAKRTAEDMQQRLGSSLSLQKVLDEAQKAYGPKEKARRDGSLWIDRQARTYFVTLGALHGLTPGAKLLVYDGEEEIGAVRVETPLDVISYVRPINKDLKDFPADYYRVVIPENNF